MRRVIESTRRQPAGEISASSCGDGAVADTRSV